MIDTRAHLGRFNFSSSKRQECSYIGDILQSFQHGDKMEQAVVRGVIDPAFNGDSIVCSSKVRHS